MTNKRCRRANNYNSRRPHDTTIILGDFNAVTGSDRHGFESVIG